jgi:NADH:ubiquinone reductase (H+-translocating)
VAHIYFLIGVKNRFIVAFTWFWDYITFQRGARLITDVPGGDEAKAHPSFEEAAARQRLETRG